MYNLGVMYGAGDGVPVDEAEGIKWLRLAAQGGSADAVELLAQLENDQRDHPAAAQAQTDDMKQQEEFSPIISLWK